MVVVVIQNISFFVDRKPQTDTLTKESNIWMINWKNMLMNI